MDINYYFKYATNFFNPVQNQPDHKAEKLKPAIQEEKIEELSGALKNDEREWNYVSAYVGSVFGGIVERVNLTYVENLKLVSYQIGDFFLPKPITRIFKIFDKAPVAIFQALMRVFSNRKSQINSMAELPIPVKELLVGEHERLVKNEISHIKKEFKKEVLGELKKPEAQEIMQAIDPKNVAEELLEIVKNRKVSMISKAKEASAIILGYAKCDMDQAMEMAISNPSVNFENVSKPYERELHNQRTDLWIALLEKQMKNAPSKALENFEIMWKRLDHDIGDKPYKLDTMVPFLLKFAQLLAEKGDVARATYYIQKYESLKYSNDSHLEVISYYSRDLRIRLYQEVLRQITIGSSNDWHTEEKFLKKLGAAVKGQLRDWVDSKTDHAETDQEWMIKQEMQLIEKFKYGSQEERIKLYEEKVKQAEEKFGLWSNQNYKARENFLAALIRAGIPDEVACDLLSKNPWSNGPGKFNIYKEKILNTLETKGSKAANNLWKKAYSDSDMSNISHVLKVDKIKALIVKKEFEEHEDFDRAMNSLSKHPISRRDCHLVQCVSGMLLNATEYQIVSKTIDEMYNDDNKIESFLLLQNSLPESQARLKQAIRDSALLVVQEKYKVFKEQYREMGYLNYEGEAKLQKYTGMMQKIRSYCS